MPTTLPLLIDGAERQRVAEDLWASWWERGERAAILTGFSGLGKTDKVAIPLLRRAEHEGRPAVRIEVPLAPTDLDAEMRAALAEALEGTDLAARVEAEPSLKAALNLLLREGALVVIDEAQRLLDESGRPVTPLGDKLRALAQTAPGEGALWLVTNRQFDPTWTEPFHQELLQRPSEVDDLVRIVLDACGGGDAAGRFPDDRRLEIVRRLGGNPRVLRLLGTLLRSSPLEALLGPPGDVPEAPADPRLTDQVERALLAKATEGLTDAAKRLLRDLSVVREPASFGLIEAVGEPLDDVREAVWALQDRFLLEHRSNRYDVHPAAREVEALRLQAEPKAWRDAHRLAGAWYARPLHNADCNHLSDAELTRRLSGARYHLGEAEAPDLLATALRRVRGYMERAYGWSFRNSASDEELNAQITLLGAYLAEPGTAGVEFSYAKRLKQRGARDDLETALPHAERATEGQDHSHPWVLWVQLVRETMGPKAAVDVARTAVDRVDPSKNLYTVYQLLGMCLMQLGRPEEAVEVLLRGAERSEESIGGGRLIDEALIFAAAQPSRDLLKQICHWASGQVDVGRQAALADVLLLEHDGEWRGAAATAREARKIYPVYLHLALHEALGWIGAEEPEQAQEALNRFPFPWRRGPGEVSMWIEALVAIKRSQITEAHQLLSLYLDAEVPLTEVEIRAVLLQEWDQGVGTLGEANPALMAPILPASVTGLEQDVRRPQYGPPVLPQHQPDVATPTAVPNGALRVLAVGTEWASGHGGLSTLNRELCRVLSAAGARVACLVAEASETDRQAAEAEGVTLVRPAASPGRSTYEALSDRPDLPDGFEPDVVIGHGRVTGPAAQALVRNFFPTAKRLHVVHMAPDEIEWLKPGREDDAGVRAETRTQIELELGRSADRMVAVGPRLHDRYLRDLSAYDVPHPLRLDPGFDSLSSTDREPPPGAPWSVVVLGRLEDIQIKGLDLAARAVGEAARQRGGTAPELELLVRGAPDGTSDNLRAALREWSRMSQIVVRPYTSDAATLGDDLRRASLLLMPSRAEGFGLVGLEAIAAGTPALISARSGLGQLLGEVLDAEQAARFVVPVVPDDAKDVEVWAREVARVLSDREAAFERAAEVRALLAERRTWATAAEAVLAAVETMRA